jgi:hypothetical protein
MTDFIVGSEYIFVGKKDMINKYIGDDTQLKLGKFKNYDIAVWGHEFMVDGKAVFENGTIDSGQYNNVHLYLDDMDIFKNVAIYNLESLKSK